MNANYLWRRSLTLAMELLLVTAGVAVVQLRTGEVRGMVFDAQGGPG